MGVANLGYIGLSMTEPDQWVGFGSQILGLMPVDRADAKGAKFLAMDDAPFRVMIEKGEADRFAFAGWDAGSETNFNALVGNLRDAGANPVEGSAEEAARRCVTAFVTAQDPSGNVFELFHTRTEGGTDFESPVGIEKFVTGEMGLGHIVIPAPEQEACHKFYTEVLGFGDSDDLHLPPPAEGAPDQRIVFMHADNPRHHSLALYNFPHPAGIVHMMVEVTSLDEVGAALDRLNAADGFVLASLGRHENDQMVSFYAMGPGGIAVEFGYDGLQLDWDQFEPTQSTLGDIWGHEYNFPQPE